VHDPVFADPVIGRSRALPMTRRCRGTDRFVSFAGREHGTDIDKEAAP
jgi:hypothetical protein